MLRLLFVWALFLTSVSAIEVEREGLEAALKGLKPGTTLKLIPGDAPWPNGIRIEASGTAEAPIVIDGRGTVVSGRRVFAEDEWTAEVDGSFSRLLENNAWGMESHWEGGFPLVWFDGVAAANAETRDALQPGGAFLYKNRKDAKTDPLHNRLFIKLPKGTNYADIEVESIDGLGGVYVGGDYVTVKNFVCEYGGRDGFATHRNVGVVFENIEARFFMDQGISNHGAEVVVRDGWFHSNAGAGIVDVYPECRVRYERCRIESNAWRGGVEFHHGVFEMIDCDLVGNPNTALVVTKGAQLTIRDCRIAGSPVGIRFGGDESSLRVSDSVVSDAETGAEVSLDSNGLLEMTETEFQEVTRPLYVKLKGDAPTATQFVLSDNALGSGPLELWRAGIAARFFDEASLVEAVTTVVE